MRTGVGFGKEGRKGTNNGFYYQADSYTKYVTNDQENIQFFDRI